MQRSKKFLRPALVLLIILGAVTSSAWAQTPRTATSDRLFLSFAEDAAVAQDQWWEGQLEFTDFDPTDATTLRAVVALQLLEDVEFGGSVGFGSTDAPSGLPDGSGATDLDLWAKYAFTTNAKNAQFAVGALATVPTGDDTSGLGFDSFGLEVFGSVRYRLPELIITGSVGLRVNEDGSIQGFPLEGRNSPFLAGGVIYPLSDKVSVIGEFRLEAERFRGFDEDFRILGGVNWRRFNQGSLRVALAAGLTDGAPDTQLIAGYVQVF